MTTVYALDFKESESDSGYTHLLTRKPVTEVEYWEKYYHTAEVTYEWHDGHLEEKAMSDVLTIAMYKWFLELLEHYLRTHLIAQSVLLEMGFRLSLAHSIEIRRPDLGVVKNDNPIPLLPHDKSYHGTFDLCVEALSDSTTEIMERDTLIKKQEYAQGGVPEYYILDSHRERLKFYTLNKARGIYLPIKPTKQGIIKSKVLPGFQFRLDDLLNRPSPDDMINDRVYQDFVLPGYRQVKLAYEAEAQARQKAEQRVQELSEKLRALGIEPDQI
jgi:hypothetical protein